MYVMELTEHSWVKSTPVIAALFKFPLHHVGKNGLLFTKATWAILKSWSDWAIWQKMRNTRERVYWVVKRGVFSHLTHLIASLTSERLRQKHWRGGERESGNQLFLLMPAQALMASQTILYLYCSLNTHPQNYALSLGTPRRGFWLSWRT